MVAFRATFTTNSSKCRGERDGDNGIDVSLRLDRQLVVGQLQIIKTTDDALLQSG